VCEVEILNISVMFVLTVFLFLHISLGVLCDVNVNRLFQRFTLLKLGGLTMAGGYREDKGGDHPPHLADLLQLVEHGGIVGHLPKHLRFCK